MNQEYAMPLYTLALAFYAIWEATNTIERKDPERSLLVALEFAVYLVIVRHYWPEFNMGIACCGVASVLHLNLWVSLDKMLKSLDSSK